ncbi:MAG: FG-GAP-like repeat-containing protein [Candidatus Acidiferrum sp.]
MSNRQEIRTNPLYASRAAHESPARRPGHLAALLAAAVLTLGSAGIARAAVAQESGAIGEQTSADYAAQKAANRGDKAEAAGKIEQAWKDYEDAARLAPKDKVIVERAAALRSRVIREHAERAEHLALDGRLTEATAELNQGLLIDPGNTVLAQRLLEMKSLDDELPAQPRSNAAFPRVKPKPGKKSFNLRGEVKSVYEQVLQQFGLTVTFDPDLAGRSVKFRAQDVDFRSAMLLLGAQSQTFYRVLNDKQVFVAADTADKRKQYILEGEQTFPLPASVASEEMTELLRVLREMTGSTHMELDSNRRSLTMRDTPEKLQLAGQIIEQAERSRGEILLEVELLEVDKGTAQSLGITPPFPVSGTVLTPQEIATLAASTTVASALTALASILSGNGISNAASYLPIGGGNSTFLVSLGAVAADFSDSLSVVRSGRDVLLRAQNGKPATFFVGDRYPITLSLLSGSLAGGAAATNNIGLTGLANFSPTTFPLTQFSVGLNPSALVANNFTSGTLPDLAVVYNNPGTTSFTILQNQDNGNFTTVTPGPITLGAMETGQVAVATGVFRNDATKFPTAQPADVVLVNKTSNTISVLLGNGDGTFVEAPNSPIAVGKSPTAVAVADFNNDGFLDLAVANSVDNTISLFRGNGDGTFTQFPASPFAMDNTAPIVETGPVALATGFFGNATNESNEQDLAIVNQTSNNVVIWLTSVDSNLNVTFTQAVGSPIAVGTTPVAIATGDFNADGVTDFAVVNQGDDTVSVFLGSANENGSFVAAANSPFSVNATAPAGIVAASFSGGTTPDLAITNSGSATLSFFVANGDGTFTAGGLLSQGVQLSIPAGPTAIITSDLSTSNDQLPDVAFVSQASGATSGVVGVVLDSTAFAATNNGTSGETPYPGSEFEDLGVKVKVTPTLHPNHEVTLQLEFEIRALANASINGIPILSNRTLSQTVRVPVDQPTVLGGLTDTEETRTITGLPGFAEIPGPPGYAFGDHSDTYQDTELLIVVTPRELRAPDHDTKTIYAGRGEPGGPTTSSSGIRQFESPRGQQPVDAAPQPGQPGAPPAGQPASPQPGTPPATQPGAQPEPPTAQPGQPPANPQPPTPDPSQPPTPAPSPSPAPPGRSR